MVPPNFAPDPAYTSARVAAATLARALAAAAPHRVAALSSIGGHRESGLGLITQVRFLEGKPGQPRDPDRHPPAGLVHGEFAVGRGACAGDRRDGVFPTAARPPVPDDRDRRYRPDHRRRADPDLDRAPRDRNRRTEALRAERGCIPARRGAGAERDGAGGAAGELGRAFPISGCGVAAPRIEMLDGFNSGWIDFERGGERARYRPDALRDGAG